MSVAWLRCWEQGMATQQKLGSEARDVAGATVGFWGLIMTSRNRISAVTTTQLQSSHTAVSYTNNELFTFVLDRFLSYQLRSMEL